MTPQTTNTTPGVAPGTATATRAGEAGRGHREAAERAIGPAHRPRLP